MVTLRVVLFVVMIIAAMFAACGLFNSLFEFGVGVAVVGLAWCGQGLVTWLHDRGSV